MIEDFNLSNSVADTYQDEIEAWLTAMKDGDNKTIFKTVGDVFEFPTGVGHQRMPFCHVMQLIIRPDPITNNLNAWGLYPDLSIFIYLHGEKASVRKLQGKIEKKIMDSIPSFSSSSGSGHINTVALIEKVNVFSRIGLTDIPVLPPFYATRIDLENTLIGQNY